MKKSDDQSKSKAGFSEKQKQTLKKYAIYGLMFVSFLGLVGIIFRPKSEDQNKKQKDGLNTEVPAPKKAEISDKKKDIYEQEYMKQKQDNKVKALNNFTLLTAAKDTANKNNRDIREDMVLEEKRADLTIKPRDNVSSNPIRNSVASYKSANEAVSGFYNTSTNESEEMKKLKVEMEELKEQLQEKKKVENRVEEQTALMEKSYQLAAKYFPSSQGLPGSSQNREKPETENKETDVSRTTGKKTVTTVQGMEDEIVSALAQQISDQELIELFSPERNLGFHSPDDESTETDKNTIPVCVDRNQAVTDGQNVSLRLQVAIKAKELILPKNAVITGKGQIQGERLYININSLEYGGVFIKVDLIAYDLNGIQGISIPELDEVNAAKEIAANMGGNLGTSISLTSSAGQQIASDLSKSLIQGTSQYLQKKIKKTTANLKAGYHLMLISGEN